MLRFSNVFKYVPHMGNRGKKSTRPEKIEKHAKINNNFWCGRGMVRTKDYVEMGTQVQAWRSAQGRR